MRTRRKANFLVHVIATGMLLMAIVGLGAVFSSTAAAVPAGVPECMVERVEDGSSAGRFRLRWQLAPGGADRYVVSRQVNGSGPWHWRAAVDIGEDTTTADGVVEKWSDIFNERYVLDNGRDHVDTVEYRIASKDSSGAAATPTVCRWTVDAVSIVDSEASASSQGSVELSWSESEHAQTYVVVATHRPSSVENPIGEVKEVTVEATHLKMSGFRRGFWEFAVHAVDAYGHYSEPSGTSSVPMPSRIESAVASGDGTATISWSDSPDAVGYQLHKRPIGDSNWQYVEGSWTSDLTQTIEIASSWEVLVEATVGPFLSRRSAPSAIEAGTADSVRPSTPSGFTATATDDGASLAWKPSTDSVGIAGYEIYRDDDGENPARTELITSVAGTETTATIGDLVPGETYHYYVKAFDAAGNRSWRSNFAEVEASQVDGCGRTGGQTGRWQTALVCAGGEQRWELLNPDGEVAWWEAVNVRAYDYLSHDRLFPGSEADMAHDMDRLASRFDQVRLALKWRTMQPSPGQIDEGQAQRVIHFLDEADQRGIDVILDLAHLGGKDAFGIPDWAWPTGTAKTPKNSYLAWAGGNDRASNLIEYVDALETADVLTHPAVAAVEVVNEPHPNPERGAGATSEVQQRSLMVAYRNAIEAIRRHDPNMLVVLGAYHGGTRFGGSLTSDLDDASNGYYDSRGPAGDGFFDYNHAKSELTDKGVENLVWTAHSYYTGVTETARLSGQLTTGDGQKSDGGRPSTWGDYATQAPQVWAEDANSGGCYTGRDMPNLDIDWTSSCDPVFGSRAIAQTGIRLNAEGSWRYSQAASMPFFMGEWGAGRARYLETEYQGWFGADKLICDKLEAFEDVLGVGGENAARTSWAVWSFNAETDGFGLYMPRGANRSGSAFDGLAVKGEFMDSGRFGASGNNSEAWNGRSWAYGLPLQPSGPGSCR